MDLVEKYLNEKVKTSMVSQNDIKKAIQYAKQYKKTKDEKIKVKIHDILSNIDQMTVDKFIGSF